MQDDMLYYEDDGYDPMYDDDMPGGDGILGDLDDGIFESVVIIGLVTALVFLVLYRQQRQQAARQQEEDDRRRQQQPQQRGQEQDRNQGLFPPPGDPNLGMWAAGGVGH
jgi:SEL1 protein